MDFNQAAAFRKAVAKLDREVKAPRVQAAPIGADKVIRRDELKGNNERFLRIRTSLFDQIRETFQENTFLFETSGGRALSRVYISTHIHKLALDCLGRKLGAHALRDSFATWAIRRTNKVEAQESTPGEHNLCPVRGTLLEEGWPLRAEQVRPRLHPLTPIP